MCLGIQNHLFCPQNCAVYILLRQADVSLAGTHQVCEDFVGGERQEPEGVPARQEHLLQSVPPSGGWRLAEGLVQR